MTKYTVKAEVDNVIQNEDSTFDYNQKVVSMKWDGDYSDRKKYQLKRNRTTPLTKEEIEHRHEQLKKDHEGYEYARDRDRSRTHKD